MFQKGNHIFLFLLTVCLCLICLLYSKQLFDGISYGIQICLNTLIPSMFGFMILSDFIANSPLNSILSKPFSIISKYLFRMESKLFPIFLMSILGGYPIGARLIAQKIKQQQISPQAGQRLLSFCINCSPAFLLSGVSLILWGNLQIGVLIYLSQVCAAILIGILSGIKKPVFLLKEQIELPTTNWSVTFVNAVNHSTKSMGVVCSFVVIFCGLFRFLDLIPLSKDNNLIIKGLLEVTSGCQLIQDVSFFNSILLVCLFTSFGGICVFLQIAALLNGCQIKMLPLLGWRILYTACSLLFTYLGILTWKPVISCFQQIQKVTFRLYSVSPISSIFLIILVILLLLFSQKSARITDKKK